MSPSSFNKIFGSGLIGLAISLALLYISWWINRRYGLPHISDNSTLLNGIFIASVVLTMIIIVWSVISLPDGDRGNKRCTNGAFRYVRHPLYAAFLSVGVRLRSGHVP